MEDFDNFLIKRFKESSEESSKNRPQSIQIKVELILINYKFNTIRYLKFRFKLTGTEIHFSLSL